MLVEDCSRNSTRLSFQTKATIMATRTRSGLQRAGSTVAPAAADGEISGHSIPVLEIRCRLLHDVLAIA
jgi:hypothetical protein